MILDLTQINPHNKALKFIQNRIQLDNYRGLQFSQHNRYNQQIAKVILTEFYKIAGDGLMQIRSTDLSKRPYALPEEQNYTLFIKNLKTTLGRCTEDSVRKNFFVDFNRMGFISRFDKNKKLVLPNKRANIKYIQLSPMGLNFIQASNLFQERVIYSEALKNIFGDFIDELMLILTNIPNNKLAIIFFVFFMKLPPY